MLFGILYWIGIVAASAVVLGGIALAVAYFYFRRSLPKLSGAISLPGLEDAVEIIRDVDAVPHIYAKHKKDAYFALGYVHAQDRLWQMEFQRRFASGQIAEILGSRAVPLDRIVRTIGMHRAALSAWESLPSETREIIGAYTAGINALIGQQPLPPEFKLLRFSPQPWMCSDVLVCSKLIAWNLGGTYMLKLLKEELIKAFGQDAAQFMSEVAGWMPPVFPRSERRLSVVQRMAAAVFSPDQVLVPVFRNHGESVGSNNWVVSGKKSTSQKPILAADPHLSLGMPSSWYVAHICAGELNTMGATFPGIPGVIMGRNKKIAWGLTNTNGDVQDLYYERLGEDGTSAEYQGQRKPVETIMETIKVRGKQDEQVQVRVTMHGPLISDAMNVNLHEAPGQTAVQRKPMALRWTALNNEDTTLQSFLELNEAESWEEFNQALKKYVVPPVNFGYADKDGDIGYCIAGLVPIRKWDNSIPAEGSDGDQEWDGYIPFEEMPRLHNPEEQFVATANTRLVPDGYPYSIGPNLVEPYRHRRIVELLEAKEKLNVEDHIKIQGDVVSLHAREFLPLMLGPLQPQGRLQEEAIETLSRWDYEMSADSVAACIFAVWFTQIPRLMLKERMGDRLFQDYSVWITYVVRWLRANLFIDPAKPQDEGSPCVLQQTFELAMAELQARLGRDITAWQWGRLHTAVHAHQPFGMIPGLKKFFSRRVQHGGDWSTINAAGMWSSKAPYEQSYGANYRQIINLAYEDGGVFIQSTGQSGHFLSPNYADYVKDWASLQYRPMRFSRTTVLQNAAHRLCLNPDSAGHADTNSTQNKSGA